MGDFWVTQQYSDLHIGRRISEQAAKRPRRVVLFIAKELVNDAYYFHT